MDERASAQQIRAFLEGAPGESSPLPFQSGASALPSSFSVKPTRVALNHNQEVRERNYVVMGGMSDALQWTQLRARAP